MPSNDDLLFAEHAVRAGFLTQEAVDESVAVQRRMAEMGVHESLAGVLVKRGALKDGDAAIVARRAGLTTGREPIAGYELIKRIGTGAMGSVYLAFQKGMRRHVAIKILRRDLTDDPRQVERLRREAALVGRLDHPHIVRGLDSGETGGLVWFVMEYVDGVTLRQLIRAKERMELSEALDIVTKLADALCHAHANGVVHRDIKPGNVLLTKDGEPRLSDYGLAKGETDDALTHVDATLGTPQYIAPEQARNPRDADIRSDIYSLGATFYTMLTGHPPFEGDTLAQILTQVLYQRPRPLEEIVPGIPAAAVYVVERMMAKNREHRYATPEELLADLRALSRGKLQVPLGYRGDFDAFVRARRRRRAWTVGVTAAVALAGVALAFDLYQEHRASVDAMRLEQSRLTGLSTGIGEPSTWTRVTVAEMVQRLTAFLDTYPANQEARDALTRWRYESAALERVNALSGGDEATRAPWPTLLQRHRDLLEELRVDAGAQVARRELERLLDDRTAERDQAARDARDAAVTEVSELGLIAAAEHLGRSAESIEETYYGGEPAPPAEKCRALAADFRAAAERIDAHFAPLQRALDDDAALEAREYHRLDLLLTSCSDAANGDAELLRTLDRLPPRGHRRDELMMRYELSREPIERACQARWQEVRSEVQRLRDDRQHREALRLLAQFQNTALDAERRLAEDWQEQVGKEVIEGRATLAGRTRLAEGDFLDAVGSRSYADAARVIDELERFARDWPDPENPGLALATSGRQLLRLIEERAWGRLRAHLAAGRPLDQGIGFVTIRWAPSLIERYSLAGDRVTLVQKGHATPLVHPLSQIAREDLFHYAGLDPTVPEDALVMAAVLLTEYRMPSDGNLVAKNMLEADALLTAAAGTAEELRPVRQLLDDRRRAFQRTAQEELAASEQRAEQTYDDARTAMEAGNFAGCKFALDKLDALPLVRTAYVRENRAVIAILRTALESAQKTNAYAVHFPGATMRQRGVRDGGELMVDFGNPLVSEWLHVDKGAHEFVTRDLPLLDLAGRVGGDDVEPPPLLLRDRVLAWKPWDGSPERHPRRFPIWFESPFEYRKPVEVSFLYRSDAPYALIVSIGGATAGVLSSEDDTEGGRGVVIWHANDLERPDKAFGDKNRPGYLDTHPDAARTRADTEFFQFEPGRVYRIRFVKEERRARLFVDEQLLASGDIKPSPTGSLSDRILLMSYTSGEIDALTVTGTLDPLWRKGRK